MMFEYELHLARRAELQRSAREWRLAQRAKAAQADRRASDRRSAAPVRQPSRSAQEPGEAPLPAHPGSRALRPHRA